MDHSLENQFITQILRWIDANIDKDISIKDIINRSGYSSAQLYRLFTNNVGCTLSDYVHNKRMYRCASSLKFSNLPISTLSARCYYANPQAFTRAFKNFFGMSPKEYRDNAVIDFHQLFSWKHKGEMALSGCLIDYVNIGQLKLAGVEGIYQLSFDGVGEPHYAQRGVIESNFQALTQRPIDKIYTLCRPHNDNSTQLSFLYRVCIAQSDSDSPTKLHSFEPVSGDYLKFHFENTFLSPYEYNSIAYWGFISPNRIKRRNGYDIELFDYVNHSSTSGYSYTLFIPVFFDNELINALLALRG
ncbi:helix-turn-helix transcriptional regulator [Enterobacter cloacae complex sp. P6RS]|uniref:helix-turn-helix domain-containing protein n=1 Tax=unclassified Enterobacter cloacae complex TaxID=2757714 RepID=UPI00187443B4|nr:MULTISPECIES: helix-turn-helix domain-containing protein [unclassified Enterobacter cloacae complex]MBE4913769.1 helix-turn-helix transcriptional regulator [Enterobacter cloacae complex sp. P4RS]MBE4990684.1 helix-turn-helix transcriptional regulator [Enterobacter cloacae complex sp. P6RS]